MSDLAGQIEVQIPRLRRYARALTGDKVTADDLVQDCLARAWGRRRLWRSGTNLGAWLFTIMHNVYINQCRRYGRAPVTYSLEEVQEPRQPGSDPADGIRMRELESALATLPEGLKEVLLLVTLEGMSYAEVACVLGIPVGTVMSRLHRARERLRVSLNGEAPRQSSLRRVK